MVNCVVCADQNGIKENEESAIAVVASRQFNIQMSNETLSARR